MTANMPDTIAGFYIYQLILRVVMPVKIMFEPGLKQPERSARVADYYFFFDLHGPYFL
jgi:hypothetical protein